MKQLFVICLGLFLLSWCSQISNTWDKFWWGEWVNSWVITHVPLLTTWAIELSPDEYRWPDWHNPYYYSMSGTQWCRSSESMWFTPILLCEWIQSYNHLYKIPSLRLEYIYNSEIFVYKDSSYKRFFTATWWSSPIILSWNIMYQVGQNEHYPMEDPIILLKKKASSKPQDVIDDLISNWCDASLITGNSFTWYVQYFVPAFKDQNIDNYTWLSNMCIPSFPTEFHASYWRFVFSTEQKDYYYVIWDPWAGNAPPRYTDQSLKLFVE